MRNLLLQLDSSSHPSVLDRVVAYNAGADEVMSYGGVDESAVRDLVHGTIFTRGTKDLHHTAVFVGGTDMPAGEKLLAAVRKAFFGPLRVSVMLDANGSNTTAVAAVAKLERTVGSLQGRRAIVTAGSGPVGMRAAGLLAKVGASVTITTRRPEGQRLVDQIGQRFGVAVHVVSLPDPSRAAAVMRAQRCFSTPAPRRSSRAT